MPACHMMYDSDMLVCRKEVGTPPLKTYSCTFYAYSTRLRRKARCVLNRSHYSRCTDQTPSIPIPHQIKLKMLLAAFKLSVEH